MQLTTEYPGPRPDDYANVLALNNAYIKATYELKSPQRGRLSSTPFLLFSLREDNLGWWQAALTDQSQRDLIEQNEPANPQLRRIQTAGLSFLWQLARRDPYSARLISGATIAWCEIVTQFPLLILLDRVAGRPDLIQSRLTPDGALGQQLLSKGTSVSARLRHASQLAALQALLTRHSFDSYASLPAAACDMSGPMRVRTKKL